MGQYHMLVNIDKKEYVDPWGFDGLAKAQEELHNKITPAGLFFLMVCPAARGVGDFDEGEYAGRWHGDRVVVLGDYFEADDFEGAADLDWSTIREEWTNIADGLAQALIAEGYSPGWDWQKGETA